APVCPPHPRRGTEAAGGLRAGRRIAPVEPYTRLIFPVLRFFNVTENDFLRSVAWPASPAFRRWPLLAEPQPTSVSQIGFFLRTAPVQRLAELRASRLVLVDLRRGRMQRRCVEVLRGLLD